MSEVVGLPSNTYKPITNTAWVRARLCKLQKGCTRFAAASDKVYQLLTHDWWFSTVTTDSSTTKTGRHDIVEILWKVALNTINQIFVLVGFGNFIEWVLDDNKTKSAVSSRRPFTGRWWGICWNHITSASLLSNKLTQSLNPTLCFSLHLIDA